MDRSIFRTVESARRTLDAAFDLELRTARGRRRGDGASDLLARRRKNLRGCLRARGCGGREKTVDSK